MKTHNYISVKDVKNEITDLNDEAHTLQRNVSHVKDVVKDATANNMDKVERAGEETLSIYEFERQELVDKINQLANLLSDIEQYSCVEYPEVINEEHLETHFRDWTMDVYGIDIDAFPFCYISWDNAIENMTQQDYKSIEFDGETFWVKCA